MVTELDPTTRQRDLRSRARRVSQDVLAKAKGSTERLPTPEERFAATKPAYERLISDGFLRACIPESLGGDSQSLMDLATVFEELYCGDSGVALTLVGTVLGLQPVLVGGTPAQQKQFLAPFLATSGAPLAGFCSSEPGGSANAGAPQPAEGVRTRARRDGDDWVISGRKKWVSSATGWDGSGADLLCVVARTDADAPPEKGVSIIAVERPIEGLVLDRTIDTPGHRNHLLPEFTFSDVRTPADHVIGDEGGGLGLAGRSFTSAAALIGMLGVALMRTAFDHVLEFAHKDDRGGPVPVIQHPAVGYALVDAKTRMEAARALASRACAAIDAGEPGATELANHSKIFGSETAVSVITELTRVVGVDSYDVESPLNGLLQDALALPVFASGNLGMRRRTLHGLFQRSDYDPHSTFDPA